MEDIDFCQQIKIQRHRELSEKFTQYLYREFPSYNSYGASGNKGGLIN
ncbi:MAG: hypothetical protein Q4D07_07100 [Selenomonadaceae bacterium]|nr:hypothetical protein [Selenomonadaceae bacterium]